MTYTNPYMTSVTYELSTNLQRFNRKNYSSLDFLSSLGGLSAFIRPICLLIISILQYNGPF